MNTQERSLPPNPYAKEPIRVLEQLAGRSREIKEIDYYLSLTVSGQSPHIALIGQRGVGKTSLLNATEALAIKKMLLPVRIDMNEDKGAFPSRFWYDVYSSLVMAMAEVGCWGGKQGEIFLALFNMLYADIPSTPDKAVLSFPFAYSSFKGKKDDFICPDALLNRDMNTSYEELKRLGYTGLVFIIDEADCLGANKPLIQQLRNVFQRLTSCSLVLAGTEAVFPSLSLVFSPIPRQFHRITISPFSRLWQTWELVFNPLRRYLEDGKHFTGVPDPGSILDLHEICGGDPAELQLYCHHMYKQVEEGDAERMQLHPQVYRQVLAAYRENISPEVMDVVNAITRLPNTLLFQTEFLTYYKLSASENADVLILGEELNVKRLFTEEEREMKRSEVRSAYKFLFDRGITSDENHIFLKGFPTTKGFWKSYVEAEKLERWLWSEETFDDVLSDVVLFRLTQVGRTGPVFMDYRAQVDSLGISELLTDPRYQHLFVVSDDDGEGERNSTEAPSDLKVPKDTIQDLLDLGNVLGRNGGTVIESLVEVKTAKSEVYRVFSIVDYAVEEEHERLVEWFAQREDVLQSHGIEVSIQRTTSFEVPGRTSRQAFCSAMQGRDVVSIGIGERSELAYQYYLRNDFVKATNIFEEIAEDVPEPDSYVSVAYCYIAQDRLHEAKTWLTKSLDGANYPLAKYNLAIISALEGNLDASRELFGQVQNDILSDDYEEEDILCIYILNKDLKKVHSRENISLSAGCLYNLMVIGREEKDVITEVMMSRFRHEADHWLDWLEKNL